MVNCIDLQFNECTAKRTHMCDQHSNQMWNISISQESSLLSHHWMLFINILVIIVPCSLVENSVLKLGFQSCSGKNNKQ